MAEAATKTGTHKATVEFKVADLPEVKAAFERAEAVIGQQTSSLRQHRKVLARKCELLAMAQGTFCVLALMLVPEEGLTGWLLAAFGAAGVVVALLDRRQYLKPVENPVEVLERTADPTRPQRAGGEPERRPCPKGCGQDLLPGEVDLHILTRHPSPFREPEGDERPT